MNYIKFLSDLISLKSITPESAGAIEYIADLLDSKGFEVILKTFGDNEVANLYAVYNSKASRNLCFAGHVDVVPPGDLRFWSNDPFKCTVVDDIIYGRGAVDMKGAIACMLSSVFDFLREDPNFAISFLITSDEEGDAEYGTKAMLEHISQWHKIDFVILGEPTSKECIGDSIKIGRRGSVNFNLIVDGVQGHVAYPEEAKNPIPILMAIISKLSSIDALQVTSIDVANQVTNVIPAQASAKFNVRFYGNSKDVIDCVESILSDYQNCTLSYKVAAEGFMQEKTLLMEKFSDVIYRTLGVKAIFNGLGGTSDARFIKNYCPVLEFGLLSRTAHQFNENVQISDLQKLHNVYYGFLKEFGSL